MFLDGKLVARRRGKTVNSYCLDEKIFHALRTDVPDEIAAVLNVDESSFQQQFDQAFWLSLSPGECARERVLVPHRV